ncbi:MAG: hypothetical protein NXI22_07160 [bacterium]|nr:hypothetical protein [bacterium]
MSLDKGKCKISIMDYSRGGERDLGEFQYFGDDDFSLLVPPIFSGQLLMYERCLSDSEAPKMMIWTPSNDTEMAEANRLCQLAKEADAAMMREIAQTSGTVDNETNSST